MIDKQFFQLRQRSGILFRRLAIALLLLGLLGTSAWASGHEQGTESVDEVKQKSESETLSGFQPDFVDNDLLDSRNRAWEYRPYLVAVWFCLDGAPVLESVYSDIAQDVTRRSELIDPCGWDLTTGLAPAEWRNQFQNSLEDSDSIEGISELKELEKFDKLMVVCLGESVGAINIRVREYDVQTRLWGPLVTREVVQNQQIGSLVMQAINVAFMPLAQIDRVQEIEVEQPNGKIKKKDEVVMRLRAVNSCIQANSIIEQHPKFDAYSDKKDEKWVLTKTEPEPIEASPVYIKESDRFLPIIRLTDRAGNLDRLQPIDFTYLIVNPDSNNDAEIRCSIESNRGYPLSQRKSKRSQKLAVVIRPPQRSTTLRLVSNDKNRKPMEGFDIYSRRPNQTSGNNEYLGKTDWKGTIEIPPAVDGLRIIMVSRGTRKLRRLPIMPGLYDLVESTLPNDETRLYAEGVIRGLENEVLSLVIRRQVKEDEIDNALKNKQVALAKEIFDEYRELETAQDIKDRMSAAEVNLKTQTSDKGELAFINQRFDVLRGLVNKQQQNSKELELTKKFQTISVSSPE